MKKILSVLMVAAMLSPVMAGMIKESQARREVDDAKQALAAMEARAELNTYLPEMEAYRARMFYTKAFSYLNDSDYDKASFYGVLSTNYAKLSVARALVQKAERDKLEALASGRALELVVPTLRAAGLKRKGSSGIFAGVYDVKALYDIKRVPWKADDVPAALSADMQAKMTDIANILKTQADVKAQIAARGRSEDHAAKYAASIKDSLIEKGIDVARVEVTTKRGGKDGAELTLSGVKAK